MVFNSFVFLLFLIAALALWNTLGPRARRIALLVISYAFYASWEPAFLLLLMFSTGLDYFVGRRLEAEARQGARKALLGLSLVGNLGLLFYFKYFLVLWDGLTGQGELQSQIFHVEGYIPPGISFYTFQTLSYTIDVYRKKTRACRSLWDFAIFVSFFPQLVAGPIVRADEFLPQLTASRRAGAAALIQGAELFALGLFKKVVIADNVALAADKVYGAPGDYTGASMVLAAVLFLVQVYCDFSGYSTMARGLAKMFGFSLPKNFDYPWLAGDPLTYRRSWHITMGSWFRDYVFRPLGGFRCHPVRGALNLMLVWALFGIWHGAGWNFLGWGLFNGAVQVTWRTLRQRGLVIPAFPGKYWAGCVFNFCVATVSVLIFRGEGIADTLTGLGRAFTLAADGESLASGWWWVFVALTLIHIASKRWYDEDLLNKLGWSGRAALLGGVALALLALAPEQRPFIYFQF